MLWETIAYILSLYIVFRAIRHFFRWLGRVLSGMTGSGSQRGYRNTYKAYPKDEFCRAMTFCDLYWRLEVYNHEDSDGPDSYRYAGDYLYEEIADRMECLTGRRPDMRDIVPGWVLEEYRGVM